MKKRFTNLVLTMAILASLLAMLTPQALAAVYGPTNFGTNLTWKVDTVSGVLDIGLRAGSATGSMPANWGSSGAPWYNHRASIKSVTIASGVTNIGQYAFNGCVNLGSISAPSVTSIGQYALAGCIGLTELDMRAPRLSAVKSVGNYAFSGCASLTDVTFPGVVEAIGTGAFTGCASLAHIAIDGGSSSFFSIDSYGVLYERSTSGSNVGSQVRVIKAPVGLPDSYSGIPGTVRTIDPEAFAYSNLAAVSIPASVNNIGLNAFSWSVFLKEATFVGDAPQTLPSGSRGIFDNVANGFVIHYYPYTLRWPTPPSTNWRGYTALAMTSYVTLDRSVAALEVGAVTQLKATVYPLNASQAVQWTVERQSEQEPGVPGPAAATVTSEGVVRALGLGWVDITATSTRSDGLAVTSPPCRVYVVERNVAVTGVALNKTQMTLTVSGDSEMLIAVVYPLDATNKGLVWSSSNTNVAYVDAVQNDESDTDDNMAPDPMAPLQRLIVPVAPGTATITVTTADGAKRATCTVTVTAEPKFVPVSDIALSTTTIATGADVNLTDLATVRPSNATNQNITWRIVEQTTTGVTISMGGILSFPAGQLGQTGTVVVEATIRNGLAEVKSEGEDGVQWGYPGNVDYTKRFTINIVPFLPVTSITDVPTIAFAGVPLQLTGSVNPVGASYRSIIWSSELISNSAGAHLDPASGILIAQWPGTVTVQAIVPNGRMASDGTLVAYEQAFVIKIDPYITFSLDLRANPGGSVSGAGAGQFAGGEKVSITAAPAQGYVFAGWHSTNGGDFADASRSSTQFTMPGNPTTVTAFFTYTGLPGGSVGGGGDSILPTPVHYFTNSSVYIKNSGLTFGHVTVRDFKLFSYVTLNGATLTRNAHYTASRLNGFTEIVLANGYLDALNQGPHTLTVHFTDYVSVSAVFTVLWTSQPSQMFSDIYASDWYYHSVEYVSQRGWMTARSSEPGRFRPNDPVTQGEVIDAMYRMAGSPSVINQYGQPLQGRDASYEWVLANGILPIGGYYYLDSPITRQDIALLFSRLVSVMRLRYPVVREAPAFADEWQIDPVARSAVTSLYRAGVINGRSAVTFVPLGNMTRAEFAAVLYRFSDAVEP